MSGIRKKSLQSSIWIYLGFAVGFLNIYLFTYNGYKWFTTDEYGLTTTLRELSILFAAFASVGSFNYLIKFFPYYNNRLTANTNDILGFAVKVSAVGVAVIVTLLIIGEPLIVRKFSEKSPMLVQYFYLIIPLSFFGLIFNLLEYYALGFHQGVWVNFLKEFLVRVYTLLLIVLKIFNLISIKTFLWLFAFQFLVIALVLYIYLYKQQQLYLVFTTSYVTKKFKKIIYKLLFFSFFIIVVNVLRSSIDNLIIASKLGLKMSGVSSFASYLNAIVQAPYRGIISVSLPVLSAAWKQKNITEIERIYKRSSINLLSFSLVAFFCLWLNFTEAINYFNINPDYLSGKPIILILGIMTVVEVGTGVNGYIIGTSSYWRFMLYSNLALAVTLLPLSYMLTVKLGIIGPALANLISLVIYNAILFIYLYKKFKLQPFTQKTVEIIVFAIVLYFITSFIAQAFHGLTYIIFTCVLYVGCYLLFLYIRKISPDYLQLMDKGLRLLKVKK